MSAKTFQNHQTCCVEVATIILSKSDDSGVFYFLNKEKEEGRAGLFKKNLEYSTRITCAKTYFPLTPSPPSTTSFTSQVLHVL